jgi:hypothetical protein
MHVQVDRSAPVHPPALTPVSVASPPCAEPPPSYAAPSLPFEVVQGEGDDGSVTLTVDLSSLGADLRMSDIALDVGKSCVAIEAPGLRDQQRFPLPCGVDVDRVGASFKKRSKKLVLTLPKWSDGGSYFADPLRLPGIGPIV